MRKYISRPIISLVVVINGPVYGKGIIVHKGKSTHVWSIEIKDNLNKLISVSRLTVMIINKNK